MIEVTIYLYNTIDSSSVEFYDCIQQENLFYCRRPETPINLNRSNDSKRCHHNGTLHSFSSLRSTHINVTTILHQWKSSIKKVEQYSRFIENSTKLDGYVCQCINPQSFGKNCEYLLPMGTTFEHTFNQETMLKASNSHYVQLYGEMICYMTLECNSGLLCLDWRDICDGLQQCMSGFDEDNCDKLEFNECESDEYRCMNGMCIPQEYFLDGEFDCLDWSDEIQYYDDLNCPKEGASIQCDDRMCPPYEFSCGDGQCIPDRFDFQIKSEAKSECQSRRDQYFICETHFVTDMWTLPNGRCYVGYGYNQSNLDNLTRDEECRYFLLCDLSGAVEAHCPCGEENTDCTQQLNETCPSNYIQYPKAGIMAPYVLFFYPTEYKLRPDYISVNGTIKCDGILINIPNIQFPFISKLYQVEDDICKEAKKRFLLDNPDHHQRCHQHSLTYNNHSYNLSTNICNTSKTCISLYRIKDGFVNCVDEMDEKGNISIDSICSKMQRYRFRCSDDQPTCLSVTALGNDQQDCNNRFDELWFGTRTKLSDIDCNKLRKHECEVLRQYIEGSWLLDNTNHAIEQIGIPFRYYCNTFWNLDAKEDENLNECREWWICSEEQWQCQTGQCIDQNWVLDGEWDCFDASDEDNIFYSSIPGRNLQMINYTELFQRYNNLIYKWIPFSTICNWTTEFSCLLVNVSSSLTNFTHNRPCISLRQIGDGHIDCYGGIDERNTLTHCDQSTMLGYHFKCNSSNQCIPYWNHCIGGNRCNRHSDDQFWCTFRQHSSVFLNFVDAICFNASLIPNGRCNRIPDCSFGEDEYMCEYEDMSKLGSVPFRKDKESITKNIEHKLTLIHFPANSNITKLIGNSTSVTETPLPVMSSSNFTTSSVVYHCNRGIGVSMYNDSIACFCPPQYYGDKCQFHTDRIILLLHLNFSQSIYTVNTDMKMVLKILVFFLFNNETIMSHLFHARPATEVIAYSKKMVHLLYSRSFRLLQHKKHRYSNQSSTIHDHPYSVRIEIYERQDSEEPLRIAVWEYPIYFDYLPVFRFAKVLRLTKPISCSNHLCHRNEECYRLLNHPSQHICLCKSNFTGENCSIADQHCMNSYCSSGSLCKPNYRGLLVGNEFPYCICPFDRYGEQCSIRYDQCSTNPCQNNGSCVFSSKADGYKCLCTNEYHGHHCEVKKLKTELHINESINHAAAVIQYFDIDFVSLDLHLLYQRVYRTLPPVIDYRHVGHTAPAIIIVKLYSSQIETPAALYLISVHLDVTSISATTHLIEQNHCVHVRTLIAGNKTQISPIKYHSICQNRTNLLCFRDDVYLCICSGKHDRVDCFEYDYTLDQCSHCLAGGRCIKEDRLQSICLCPPCYSGAKCQFNSNSFAFILDQLFFTDLTSSNQKMTVYLLIIGPLLLTLIALPNNIFSFVTFRRQKCLCSGIGQYLVCMSIINQINLTILVARLIHLTVIITGFSSHPMLDNIFCKILCYSLTCFTRMAFWLVSFVATERVYTTIFLKGQWLKKPKIARRLMALTFFLVFFSAAYELAFVKLVSIDNNSNSNMCVIEFPNGIHRSLWMRIHQIVSIINSVLPLVINCCCTITIIWIVIKAKMNLQMPGKNKLDF